MFLVQAVDIEDERGEEAIANVFAVINKVQPKKGYTEKGTA